MTLDPSIISSLITATGGLLAGFFGGKGIAKHQGDKRCEKIAALMVNGFDKLLTALEITGEPPEIKQAIREARDVIAIAKGHLGYISGVDSTNY